MVYRSSTFYPCLAALLYNFATGLTAEGDIGRDCLTELGSSLLFDTLVYIRVRYEECEASIWISRQTSFKYYAEMLEWSFHNIASEQEHTQYAKHGDYRCNLYSCSSLQSDSKMSTVGRSRHVHASIHVMGHR